MILQRIIGFSARNRALVLVVVAALALVAWKTLPRLKLDALPDLSDTQVIVQTTLGSLARPPRGPGHLSDRLRAPGRAEGEGGARLLRLRLVAGLRPVRGRHRPLLGALARPRAACAGSSATLPEGANPVLGPDATGVGWVYQYALVDRERQARLGRAALAPGLDAALRAPQRPRRRRGRVVRRLRQADTRSSSTRTGSPPTAFRSAKSSTAIQAGNDESGGRLLEWSGVEYMVRLRGYARTPEEFGEIVVAVGRHRSADPGRRRGADRARAGDPARRRRPRRPRRRRRRHRRRAPRRERVERHPARAGEARTISRASLPDGVEVVHDLRPFGSDPARARHAAARARPRDDRGLARHPALPLALPVGDRADRDHPDLGAARRSSRSTCSGISINIMSLAGIAISIGVLVDGAIVEVENAYNRICTCGSRRAAGDRPDFHDVRLAALQEVGPVGLLLAPRHRRRLPADLRAGRPGGAALRSARLVEEPGDAHGGAARAHARPGAPHALLARRAVHLPSARFSRARRAPCSSAGTVAEERHPISRAIHAVYEPVCRFVLRRRPKTTIAIALADPRAVAPGLLPARLGVHAAARRGHDPLHADDAARYLDRRGGARCSRRRTAILAGFPEVERVHGKAGRAETATDPAPLSMFETVGGV